MDTTTKPVTLAEVFARCEHCGDPTPGLLAGCPKPECVAKDIEIEAAWKRRTDR